MILNYRLLLPLILASTVFSVHAEERWFEVELLLFQRNTDITSTKEELVVKNHSIDTRKSIPLFNTTLEDTCKAEEITAKKPSQGIEFLDDNEEVINGVEYLSDDNNPDSTAIIKAPCVPKKLSEIPVLVNDSIFDSEKNGFQLLAEDKLQLTPQREKLTEHASFKPLLHLAWRMPVDSKVKALPIHLIAGENLALTMPAEADQVSDAAASPKWTIDGNFKIYVDHYLFIDSQLLVRQKITQDIPLEVDQEAIENIDENVQIVKQNEQVNPLPSHKETIIAESLFDQNRRLRSGEIHYFDHPLMGMIVQIRKIPKDELAALKNIKVKKAIPIKKKVISQTTTKVTNTNEQNLQEMEAAQNLIDASKSKDFMDE